MNKKITILLFSLFVTTALQASESADSSKIYFEQAFSELKTMLNGEIPVSFERAVFVSENPYWDNRYSYEAYQSTIDVHQYLVQQLAAANDRSDTISFGVKVMSNGKFKMDDIRYLPHEKKALYVNAVKNWAIFHYITDTVGVYPIIHPPFSYASDDPFGKKDWAGSQVLNLLASEEAKGNCFALAGLFKILSDRLNSGAVICTAPQHIYIQHRDKNGEMYNVELATAGHPGDGVIQTLTYTSTQAVMNGIALREYTDKESIGLCLVNLAKSYEHKFDTKDDEFMLRCAELALQYDSLNLNAHLLKQQVLDQQINAYALKNNINDIALLKADNEISGTYNKLQKQLQTLYTLGYRQMPLCMQQMILGSFSGEMLGSSAVKNPSPYTGIKPRDAKDEQYVSLSHGAFQEVFVPKKYETYGHFTIDTETKTISSFDPAGENDFLIDPVAFAYDFGARMYNAQTGTFMSVDPLAHKFAGWSPYTGLADNPIMFVDPDGKQTIRVEGKFGMNTGAVGIKGKAFGIGLGGNYYFGNSNGLNIYIEVNLKTLDIKAGVQHYMEQREGGDGHIGTYSGSDVDKTGTIRELNTKEGRAPNQSSENESSIGIGKVKASSDESISYELGVDVNAVMVGVEAGVGVSIQKEDTSAKPSVSQEKTTTTPKSKEVIIKQGGKK